MVKVTSYNIRGLNDKPKQDDVRAFLVDNNISLVGFVETRVKASKARVISNRLQSSWLWEFNYDSHDNGHIWLGWDPNIWQVNVTIKSA